MLLAFSAYACSGSGYHSNSEPELDRPTLKVKWVLKGGLSSWFQEVASVAAADGKIYVIADSADESKGENPDLTYLRSLKADTGEEMWKFGFSGMKGTVPSVANSRIYFGASEPNTGTYYLYCVDATSGDLSWRVAIGDYRNASSTPIISDGAVYLGTKPSITDDGIPYNVYALDAVTGRELWKHELDGGVSYLTQGAGMIYVGNRKGPLTTRTYTPTYLHALDSKTGTEKWTFKTLDEVSAPPEVAGSTLYFKVGNTYTGETMYAMDMMSGKLKWVFEKERTTLSVPIMAGINLYVGVNQIREHCIDNCVSPTHYTDYLYTLDPATGQERSHAEILAPLEGKPVMSGNLLYSLSSNHTLYAYDVRSGEVKWKFDLGSTATTWPVSANSLIYIASWYPGNLYALILPTPAVGAP